jgi:hypothetical protein
MSHLCLFHTCKPRMNYRACYFVFVSSTIMARNPYETVRGHLPVLREQLENVLKGLLRSFHNSYDQYAYISKGIIERTRLLGKLDFTGILSGATRAIAALHLKSNLVEDLGRQKWRYAPPIIPPNHTHNNQIIRSMS